MGLRSGGRKLSFEVLSASTSLEDDEILLYRSSSDPPILENGEIWKLSHSQSQSKSKSKSKRKHKNRGAKKKKKMMMIECSVPEDSVIDIGIIDSAFHNEHDPRHTTTVYENGSHRSEFDLNLKNYTTSIQSVVCEEVTVVPEDSVVGSVVLTLPSQVIIEPEFQSFVGELRQRSVIGIDGNPKEESATEKLDSSAQKKQRVELNCNVVRNLETEKSLDWKQLLADDPNYRFPTEKSPVKYFFEEMYAGNSLRSTTTLGNEKERERVYDTIFRLPWRCELLIDVGFFVCLDSFMSLLTIMPTRILMTLLRLLKTRQFKKLSAAELSDFGCFVVLACGVTLLEQADISLIYHMIRGQGTIKLYVVYNVLEIFDKLCQSFGGDVLQTLFNSAEGLASCSPESMRYWIWRFISDEALAVAASIVHSFILLAQAITLSTCIVAHNNALMALLVSNNFSEIKSTVFKRFSKDNIRSLVYSDSVERFHISAFLLFFLAQNLLEAEGPWFEDFLSNVLLVFMSEMMIDIIKHSFLAKFNDLKPIVYSEFLEDLCKQTLDIEMENGKKNLTFVPLAPACVVIRVLTPVYAAHLPYSPLPWRLFWIFFLCALTFVMLASLKVMIGMGLKKHATWYVSRCQKRKLHCD